MIQQDLWMPSLETEGIKYAGSKLKLIPHIYKVVSELQDVNNVLDGFSGTTRVSQLFSLCGFDTFSNDISAWSEVFATCYLKSQKPDSFYIPILEHLNGLKGKDGWFTEYYGGSENDTKKPFQIKNTRKLDAIRDEIDFLGLDWIDKCVILTSLILGLDKVDSTLGHFSSYLAKWSSRSFNNLILQLPKRNPIRSHNVVTKSDIFDVLKGNKFDLAYFDPPYGSNNEKMPPSRVRYNAYYHFWTSVVLNDKPLLFGKVNRREDTRDTANPSIFEEYRKDDNGRFIAVNAIDRLIRETNSHYILLSYSSGGRATKEELLDILSSRGNLKKFYEIDYKKNIMASMRWTNEWASDTDNKEYLFLLEK